MNTKAGKIKYAIFHNPDLIPVLKRDTSINQGMLKRLLKKAVPCRIGIEFELSGSFGYSFAKEHNLARRSFSDEFNKEITKYYNVHEINCDGFRPYKAEDIYEVRISICDYRQLRGLYKFMQDLPRYCKLHENGGIHIHVDLSDYDLSMNHKYEEAIQYTTDNLDKVESIFPKYTGTYNKRGVAHNEKGTYINFSRLHTMEFRIAPLTFDYNTLITWISKCIAFRNEVISNCRLIKDYKKKEKLVIINSGQINNFLNSIDTNHRYFRIEDRDQINGIYINDGFYIDTSDTSYGSTDIGSCCDSISRNSVSCISGSN